MNRLREKRRRRSTLSPMTQINLTSLLDLTFMLLITFIIIAPTLKHGIQIDLPEVKAAKLDVEEKTLTVTIKKVEAGEEIERVYLEGNRVDLESLTERVSAAYEKNPRLNVVVEADRAARYGIFASVVQTLQEAGVTNIGLATEPEKKKP